MNTHESIPAEAAQATLSRGHLRALALQAGFTEAGVVALPHAHEQRDAERFNDWVRAGRAGTMRYLERVNEQGTLVRERIGIPFAWARSALVCFSNYNSANPRSTDPAPPLAAWIARYAWSTRKDPNGQPRPSDYHKILKKRLDTLESAIRAALPQPVASFAARAYVDTGPVVERALATAAGIGWTGKNTCLIHPRHGSYGFLAVLLTSLELPDETAPPLTIPDRCGSCTRCLQACPTGALIAPYKMDATLCISYLTIEHKGVIGETLMPRMGRQVFGCDICQDVCPWNRKAPIVTDPDLQPRAELVNPALDWLAQMDEAEFERNFNGSPIRRAGFHGLKRNVAIAMGNSGVRKFAPLLRAWSEAADEGLRAAAQWALNRLTSES